jgi:hypothetical protein
MRTARTNDLLHNPFKNRFNDPVTWRLDEMQAHSNVVWPRQWNHGNSESEHAAPPTSRAENFSERSDSNHDGRVFASAFGLFLVLVVSIVVLFNVI